MSTTSAISDRLRRLAACPPAFGDVPPGLERVLNERFCLFFGPNRLFTSAYPFRLDDVAGVLEEVRAAARERNVEEVEWWIGPDVEPPDLARRLKELGLGPADGPDHQPWTTAMVLRHEPPGVAGVEARPVASLDELREVAVVTGAAFDSPEERTARALEDAEEQWAEREGKTVRTFGAWVDGRLVGGGRTAYVEEVSLLVSGGVVPAARGRGVYRALVRARWDDAAARGDAALLVFAGSMSKPILERVGFESLFDIEILLDEL